MINARATFIQHIGSERRALVELFPLGRASLQSNRCDYAIPRYALFLTDTQA